MSIGTLAEHTDISSFTNFDKALEERKAAKLTWPMVVLAPGEVAWIPYNHIALVTGTDDLGAFFVLPWFSEDLIQKARGNGYDLWSTALKKLARKHSGEAPWKLMLPHFDKML